MGDGETMNEKFFDLKKEKQDRMINAALKIFALKGYEHASTDDIVREAGISKGLLFHYFISKIGLYAFVYDYSVKYLMLEYSTGISKEETDYFELILQMKNCWESVTVFASERNSWEEEIRISWISVFIMQEF